MKHIFSAFLILTLSLISFRSSGQCNFLLPDLDNFNEVGSAYTNNNSHILTYYYNYTGAAWYRDSVDLTYDFDVSFSTNQCGIADGMVFVLQSCSNGLNALGALGSSLAYYGNTAAFTHSLGVELDIYDSGPDFYDDDNSHIVITRNGEKTPVTVPVHISPNLGNCVSHTLRLTWNATAQLFSAYLDDTLRTSYTEDLVNSVFAGNPHVYFGFTGSTGADYATQQFSVNYLHYHPSHAHNDTVGITSNSECAGAILTASPGGNAYLWSTGETTDMISTTSAGTYTVTVTDQKGCTQSAQYTVNTAPGDPAVFGDHVWNIYAWNAGNNDGTGGAWMNNYSGFYVETNLSFNTLYNWGTVPSNAGGYQGCTVLADNHSWSAKRQGFDCGVYQVNIPIHQYTAQLFINGAEVWEHNGCCDSHTNVWTGILDNNATVEYRVSTGAFESYGSIEVLQVNDLITVNGPSTICPGYTAQLTAVATEGSYLWSTNDTTQSIIANAMGTYSVSIAGESCTVSDSASIIVQPLEQPTLQVNGPNPFYPCQGPPSLFVTNSHSSYTYHWSNGMTTLNTMFPPSAGDYTVTATDVLGCASAPSSTVTLTEVPTPGNPAVFGDHVWNQYVWRSTNWTDNYVGYDVFGQDDPNIIQYQSVKKWYGSPSESSTYQGCGPGYDNFSWSAKRKGFPSNIYQININWHDDDAKLYIDDSLVWTGPAAAYNNLNVWTGCLGENSTVELRVKEFTGDAGADMSLIPQYTILTTNGPPTICPGFTETLTALDGADSYLWSTGETTQSISVSDSGIYSVTANINGCLLPGSKTISVAPIPTPSISPAGMNPYYICNAPPPLKVTIPDAYHTYTWSNGMTGNTITPSGTGDYTVTASDALGCTSATSAALNLSTIPPPGDPASSGDHVWNVYAYSSGNASADSTAWLSSSYVGYYVDGNLNFDSRNSWYDILNPSTAAGYSGCPVPDDNHSWSAKRKGFPCSIYSLDVPIHDDEAQLIIDGVKVWEHDGYEDSHTNVWTGWLNDSSEVEFRVTEGGGFSNGALTLNSILYYADADSDGYGAPNYIIPCGASTAGYVTNNADCNDADASIHPGNDILFDGIDNNCNGSIDESCYWENTAPEANFSFAAFRAPNSHYKSGRTVYLLNKSELGSAGLTANQILSKIGWNNLTAPSIAATGTLVIYLQNTTDNVYSKQTGSFVSWNAAINPMSIVYNNTATLPAVTGFWSIDISDAAFTYTGNGLYVAIQWINCGAVSNLFTQQLNVGTILTMGNSSAINCNPSGVISGSFQRPVTRFYTQSWWYLDADGDGFAADSVYTCESPNANWVSSVTGKGDCNDADAAVNPAATEVCNSTDDNCEGQIDEGIPTSTFYDDADGDGYGDASASTQACSLPSGYVINSTDCDVADGTKWQSASLYIDADGDGYNAGSSVVCYGATIPVGYSSATLGTDCNDANGSVNPAVIEFCNGTDDNCNGQTDEGVKTTFYKDLDNDSYGNAAVTTQACSAPSGYVANNADCNDGNVNVNPGKTEICNNIDDNCNSQIDEGVKTIFYADADGDGYGNPNVTTQACAAPSGYVSNNTDCNDAKVKVHPGAAEICNNLDDNCNGQIDENVISATITPSGTVSFCTGGNIVLTANSGTGISYQWMKNGVNISGAITKNYTANATGNYQVKETKNGCSATSVVTVVNKFPLPAATITPQGNLNICQTGSVLLKANTGTGLTYKWMKGSANILGATNSTYTATTKGNYKVVVTANGCSKTSAAVTVTKSCKLGDEDQDEGGDMVAGELNIYPNPTTGIFMIDLSFLRQAQDKLSDDETQDVTIQVYNSIGQLVQKQVTNTVDGKLLEEIHLAPGTPEGIYLVRIIAGDELFTRQVVMQK